MKPARTPGRIRRIGLVVAAVLGSMLFLAAIALLGAVKLRNITVATIAEMQRIDTSVGIERAGAVQIGGIPQWISIRGKDRRNPVLLFIHGGPGEAASPLAWTFASAFEDHFVVVHWDQRGAGKTFGLSDPEAIAPTLTYERMVADAEEVVAHLRQQLATERIIVVGMSWGSVLGLELAHRKPQWLYAYVGMGQVVNMREGERLSYERVLAEARSRNDQAAIAELTALAPYPGTKPALQSILTERKWVAEYGHLWRGRTNVRSLAVAAVLSPDWGVRELLNNGRAAQLTLDRLLEPLLSVDLQATRYQVPIFFFEGRDDLNAPSELAAAYLERIDAPQKKLVWFERTGHLILLERPGETLLQLVSQVRPLAGAVPEAVDSQGSMGSPGTP